MQRDGQLTAKTCRWPNDRECLVPNTKLSFRGNQWSASTYPYQIHFPNQSSCRVCRLKVAPRDSLLSPLEQQFVAQCLRCMLTHLFYGIAVAVKRKTDNRDKKTPGVDGETWDTPEQKTKAINSLKRRGYPTGLWFSDENITWRHQSVSAWLQKMWKWQSNCLMWLEKLFTWYRC